MQIITYRFHGGTWDRSGKLRFSESHLVQLLTVPGRKTF